MKRSGNDTEDLIKSILSILFAVLIFVLPGVIINMIRGRGGFLDSFLDPQSWVIGIPISTILCISFSSMLGSTYDTSPSSGEVARYATQQSPPMLRNEEHSVTKVRESDTYRAPRAIIVEEEPNSTHASQKDKELSSTGSVNHQTIRDLEREMYLASRNRDVGRPNVSTYTYEETRKAINEVYARYGATFPNKEVQRWAERQYWYRAVPGRSPSDAEKLFSELDKDWVERLAKHRSKIRK